MCIPSKPSGTTTNDENVRMYYSKCLKILASIVPEGSYGVQQCTYGLVIITAL